MIKRLIIKIIVVVLTLSTLKGMVEKQYAKMDLCNKIIVVVKDGIKDNEEIIKDVAQAVMADIKAAFGSTEISFTDTEKQK